MQHTILDQSDVVPGLEAVALHLDSDQLSSFFPLLQKGVTVPAMVGCTLRSLLSDQLAIPGDYVTERITTIFLDNRPVDDLDRTIVRDRSRVTLSAAMPGLVGATVRRGGFYAALRQGISHVAGSGAASGESGMVRLKLFNLMLAELGPLILARGLILEQGELELLLKSLSCKPVGTSTNTGQVLLTVLFSELEDIF
ncbi:MAG: hypothetical protein JJE30_13465 [Desulfuromonadales bacterium]|nr:hypothetical protein [Desulfuromonadales bacterium]